MNPIETAQIGNVHIGNQQPLALIGGPCVIESLEHCLAIGRAILEISQRVGIPYIFKASFDKANRSSVHSYRGPGLEEGLAILQQVKAELGVPVLSDIHEPAQAEPAGRVLDSIQIPAFLSRQTDLLVAAGRTGKNVNIKKGQFLSPEECRLAVQKVAETGNTNCLLTERGTFFGYNRLVNDMTAMPRMRRFAPVVYDATHSCQLPGGAGDRSGGAREFIEPLALAAIAAGADAIFLEIHDNPAQAKSDPATVLPLEQLKALLTRCKAVFAAVRTP
ncbi:MAG: 3-deoxy-8-phosphooctulonate synthase [Verrucomicrobiota bacterium]|nr:3-deoxy-8-phosphooctulonate synthase [Verrucomicrobiota bacterium]